MAAKAGGKVYGYQWCDCLNKNVLAVSWKLPATVKWQRRRAGCSIGEERQRRRHGRRLLYVEFGVRSVSETTMTAEDSGIFISMQQTSSTGRWCRIDREWVQGIMSECDKEALERHYTSSERTASHSRAATKLHAYRRSACSAYPVSCCSKSRVTRFNPPSGGSSLDTRWTNKSSSSSSSSIIVDRTHATAREIVLHVFNYTIMQCDTKSLCHLLWIICNPWITAPTGLFVKFLVPDC